MRELRSVQTYEFAILSRGLHRFVSSCDNNVALDVSIVLSCSWWSLDFSWSARRHHSPERRCFVSLLVRGDERSPLQAPQSRGVCWNVATVSRHESPCPWPQFVPDTFDVHIDWRMGSWADVDGPEPENRQAADSKTKMKIIVFLFFFSHSHIRIV